MIIESIMKGLAIWLYNLLLEIVEFIADALLDVFNMDMAYFESNVPVTSEIVTILLGAGWAILIGNLTFQAMKSMMSGIGFEGEDPKILFTRTFVFSFLLLASRQICTIGLNMTSTLNTLLQTPSAVNLGLPELDIFSFSGSWLLVIIIGVVLMFQLIRFFFEIAERYIVLVILTLFAPLAFGVGGSKNTEDIFKGWARMYGSACLMMVFNTVFLKLLLSAMSNMPAGTGSTIALLPWTLLVVGIARVARKIDDIVARTGLNTARTGDPLGRGGLMYPIMVARSLSGVVGKTIGGAAKASSSAPKSGTRGGGSPKPPAPPPAPSPAPAGSGGGSPNSPAGNNGGAASPPTSGSAGSSPYPGDNNAQPNRPPVGVRNDGSGRSRGQAPGTQQPPTSDEQERIVCGGGVSRDSGATRSSDRGYRSQGEFGGHGSNRPNDTSGQRSGGGRLEGSGYGNDRTQPPLSTSTRTPGVSQNPGPDGKGNQRSGQFGRKVNIDIYRDDDPPVRSPQNRPAIPNNPRPASSHDGSAGRQGAIIPPAVTVPAGKVPQVNVQPAGAAAPKGTQGNKAGQAGVVQPQIPSAPPSAESPRGGRISGGITDPSGTHRAPSKAAPPIPTGTTGAGSSAQNNTSQTQQMKSASALIERSTSTTQSSQAEGKTTPLASSSTASTAGGRQSSGSTRYRIADRSTRKPDDKGNYQSGGQPDGQRSAGQTRYRPVSRPSTEPDNKDNRTPPGNRGVTPPPKGSPHGGNPATRR